MEARCLANTVVQPLVATPLNMKCIIDSITIDNKSGVAVQVQLEDDFTQDVSAANAAPTARSAFPWQQTIPANSSYNADINSMASPDEGCPCLGNVGAICDSIQALCTIIIYYHFD